PAMTYSAIPSAFRHAILRRTATLMALALVLAFTTSCNRVPGKRDGKKNMTTAAITKTSAKPATAIIAPLDLNSPGELPADEQLPIATVCERACEHWVGLRFADPINYNKVDVGNRKTIDELLSNQRRDNHATCHAACVKHDRRDTASCILRAVTADECGLCITD
ncbi:MAG: hypothetical protein ACI9OJ_002788, partial [Myxococcota bacterium]